MKNFTKLEYSSMPELYDCLLSLEESGKISWQTRHSNGNIVDTDQICINTVPGHDDDYLYGFGNINYDWSKAEFNESGELKTIPKRETPLLETDFTIVCSQFLGTPLEAVFNMLSKRYHIGRVRLMRLRPKACLSWHKDTSTRLHYPLKTQFGNFMIIDDEIVHLEQDVWYIADTTKYHTVFNGSHSIRIHLVAEIFGEK